MIRLIVSDIDGTMVRHDKSLPDANIAAVARAKAAGIEVSLISARPPSGMMWIAKALGITAPMGAFNGSTIFGPDGAVLSAEHLTREAVVEAFSLIDAPGVTAWLFADGQWYSRDISNPHNAREFQSAGIEPMVGGDWTAFLDRADKIVGVCDVPETLAGIEVRAKAALGPRATVSRSQPYYLDILAPSGNKGAGISRIAELCEVSLTETAALGDQNNDLAAFAVAGLSVAMGQAPDNVRAAADHIATSNEDGGVADAIDRFVLAVAR